MSDTQDDAPKFADMLVTPDVSGATTPEEFDKAYYEANPWAKPDPAENPSAED